MVSLWPWKAADTSPASFEKTLSNLSSKIAQTTARLEGHRRRGRRFRALWTLYTIFLYLLYAVILALVVGWEKWGALEYSAVAGGPVLIYAVRAAADAWYRYRITATQEHLDSLQKERDATIEKLKEATRYNSTHQLLEKYGAGSPKLESTPEEGPQDGDEAKQQPRKRRDPRDRASLPVQGGRTTMPPPPTANIRRKPSGRHSLPATNPDPSLQPPSHSPVRQPSPLASQQTPPEQPPSLPPSAAPQPEFHPSAFPSSQQYSQPHTHHWYDRVLDVLLGEDETLPKNRLALICKECRLVNGQASPGVQTLEELGRWRCGGCGAWNGEEPAARRQASEEPARPPHKRSRSQSMPHGMAPAAVAEESASDGEEQAEPVKEAGETRDTADSDKSDGGKK